MASENLKEVTLKIDGMRCSMCEAHVADLLRKVAGVKKATASVHKGEAVAICDDSVSLEALSAAVSKDGYKVLSNAEKPYEKKGLFGRLFGKK